MPYSSIIIEAVLFVVTLVVGITSILVQHFEIKKSRRITYDNSQRVPEVSSELVAVRRKLDVVLKQKENEFQEKRNRSSSLVSSCRTSYFSQSEPYDFFSAQSEPYDFFSAQSEPYDFFSAQSEPYDFFSAQSEPCDLESVDASNNEATSAPVIEEFFEAIDRSLEEGTKKALEGVMRQLKELSEKFPENPHLLWRISRGYHSLFEQTSEQKHLDNGIVVGVSATQLKPALANVHKWLAILYGTRVKLKQMSEMVEDSREFKKHLDLALKLNPSDGRLHHMTGRFIYTFADMNWVQRTFASTVFTEASSASFEDALQHFKKADELGSTSTKENMLFLAKCNIKIGMESDAVRHLRRAAEMKTINGVDQNIDEEVKQLLRDTYM